MWIRKTILNADREISFSYQGGEPTLAGLAFFEKAVELQRKYNRKGIRVHNALQTNGYALNEKWCQFFVRHQFLIGLSIDGVQETHDVYRHRKHGCRMDCLQRTERSQGSPNTDRKCELKMLLRQAQKTCAELKAGQNQDRTSGHCMRQTCSQRCGVDFNILTVVNRQTAARIEDIYEDYRRRGWNYQQYIACLPPMGQALSDSAYVLSPEAYGDFLIRLFHLWYRDWKEEPPALYPSV